MNLDQIPFKGNLDFGTFKQAISLKKMKVTITILVGMTVFCLWFGYKSFGVSTKGFAIMIPCTLLGLSLFLYSEFRSLKDAYNKTEYFKYPFTGAVTTDALVFQNEISSFSIPLNKVIRLVHDSRVALVYWGEWESLIISKSFFESESHWSMAIERLKNRARA